MTCIIAHRDGWMVADRRQTFESSLIGPYKTAKIKRGPGVLVGTSGNGVFQDLVAEELATRSYAEEAIRHVAKVFRTHGAEIGGHAIALSEKGICEITSRGAVVWLEAEYWAIGSGYPFALGWLECLAFHGDKITPTDAYNAISFAADRVNDVGDGHQEEHLSP